MFECLLENIDNLYALPSDGTAGTCNFSQLIVCLCFAGCCISAALSARVIPVTWTVTNYPPATATVGDTVSFTYAATWDQANSLPNWPWAKDVCIVLEKDEICNMPLMFNAIEEKVFARLHHDIEGICYAPPIVLHVRYNAVLNFLSSSMGGLSRNSWYQISLSVIVAVSHCSSMWLL